jgi:hypothetical protein
MAAHGINNAAISGRRRGVKHGISENNGGIGVSSKAMKEAAAIFIESNANGNGVKMAYQWA